jgi:hypothetical protein
LHFSAVGRFWGKFVCDWNLLSLPGWFE